MQLPEPFLTLELDGQVVQRFALDRARTSIGRARESEIQIAVRGVSRNHAVVVRDASGRCTLEDLGSANGTFVNGARIAGSHTLNPGDLINFLDYALRFQREGAEPPVPRGSSDPEGIATDAARVLPSSREVPPVAGARPATPAPALVPAPSPSPGAAPARRPAVWEVVVDDPERGRSTVALEREVTTLGGDEGSDVRVSGRRLERHHSILVRVEEKLVFVRLSAVHLARVNGTARLVAELESGDEISLGGASITVRRR